MDDLTMTAQIRLWLRHAGAGITSCTAFKQPFDNAWLAGVIFDAGDHMESNAVTVKDEARADEVVAALRRLGAA